MFRVPENESLKIEQCLVRCGLRRKYVRVTRCVWSAVSGRFPVMIKLHMNGVHAARSISQSANIIAGCENVESGVRRVHPIRVQPSTVYGIKVNGIVFVEEKSS